MPKVVYNSCFGGFSLSRKAISRLAEWGYGPAIDAIENPTEYFDCHKIPRHESLLVQVVEELKDEANGDCAKLKIKELSCLLYKIEDFDGKENVIEGGDEWILAI
jgi:hypothetical protein